MLQMEKQFLNLMAEDLMSFPAQVIPQSMRLRDAARLLSRANISGAPVVNAEGHCVGVLSATDFVHLAERGGEVYTVHSTRPVTTDANWKVLDLEFLPNDEVGWHMTADPVTAPPSASITELARLMLNAHVHRVIVVDEFGRPLGIVSTTDIVSAVAGLDTKVEG